MLIKLALRLAWVVLLAAVALTMWLTPVLTRITRTLATSAVQSFGSTKTGGQVRKLMGERVLVSVVAGVLWVLAALLVLAGIDPNWNHWPGLLLVPLGAGFVGAFLVNHNWQTPRRRGITDDWA